MTKENSQKNRADQYLRYIVWLDQSKTVINFLVDTKRAGLQASKWISPLRQILFILLGSYLNNVALFILGKCLSIKIFAILKKKRQYNTSIYILYCSVTYIVLFFTFVYHGKTFRWHVSFSISQQIVSVKNILLQCFMETSQFIFQFTQCVMRLWFLKLVSAIFIKFLFFLPNDSLSKTMKNAFYFI